VPDQGFQSFNFFIDRFGVGVFVVVSFLLGDVVVVLRMNRMAVGWNSFLLGVSAVASCYAGLSTAD
jgi:hypothetical protein